ncbi:hypothetical protein [Paraburkholderia phosphatilytica]|uniref:hypothetical protein n=1 Tax=Paraburkholderia phosphatilytica TaxID=2282883 RepID=UPI000F603C93|nr:hypothetical protein [Paraburkholderia phosphatilytica]
MPPPFGPTPSIEAFPAEPSAHLTLAAEREAAGDALGALAHRLAAQALESYANGAGIEAAQPLLTVGTGYFMKGEHDTARRWYALALSIDPSLAAAWQNLAAIHADAHRDDEAAHCRDEAYRIQRVFVESAYADARRVLVLCAGRAAGNVPFELLLPTARFTRIKYAFDYGSATEDAQLPAADVVFNAIGEPDIAAPYDERLTRYGAQCAQPLLNPQEQVARTRRDRLPALLDGIENVTTAQCVRLDDASIASPSASARLPVLARPAASHGGLGVVRCETASELAEALAASTGPQYLTAFHDCRSADGHYRKYRVVFVDRQPYPYHLAVSPHWMVHYFSADMERNAWKLDEEHRFLRDPTEALGERAMTAIAAIGARLDLDYAGIDFTLLPDGRVFVFEGNATMLVHRERADGVLAHKNDYVQRIADAFGRLVERKAAAARNQRA